MNKSWRRAMVCFSWTNIIILSIAFLSTKAEGACSRKQHECSSGKCISQSRVCDGFLDCFDRSDEMCDCEAHGHFRCTRLNFCVTQSKLCDSVNDCVFYEDETNCESCKGYQCSNGWCLPPGRKCDQFVECPDGGDEKYCSCVEGEHRCKEDNRCILTQWLCDGVSDCTSRTDEQACPSHCKEAELACADHSGCIRNNQQCDGETQCSDGSDEFDCVLVQPDGLLLVYDRETYKYKPVCHDSWQQNPHYGNSACKLTGAGSFIKSTYTEGSTVSEWNNGQLEISNSSSPKSSILKSLKTARTACAMVVLLECAYDQCGAITAVVRLQKMHLSPRIRIKDKGPGMRLINAERAFQGQYPWQANLRYDGIPFCGGTLIDVGWIITAAHCVVEDRNPARYTASLGTLLLEGDQIAENEFLQEIPVTEIIIHPDWESKKIVNDIALLRLKVKARQTDMVRAPCWLNKEREADLLSVFKECRTSGWGYIDKLGKLLPWTLQATRMDLVSDQVCRTVFSDDYNPVTMLCAGTVNGIVTICSGDSGSPLVCRDNSNIWTLVGVASWSPAQKDGVECAGLSVFSRLSTYLSWIKQAMAAAPGTFKLQYSASSKPSAPVTHLCVASVLVWFFG